MVLANSSRDLFFLSTTPFLLGSSKSREVMKDFQIFTKSTEFFILKFPSMITLNGTNVIVAHVL